MTAPAPPPAAGWPRPPAHVAPYVEVLGHEEALAFLLEFGGGEVYLSARPAANSPLAARLGPERAAALAVALGQARARVPVANVWIAHMLWTGGMSVAAIARRMHSSDVAVRRWLKRRPDLGPATGPARRPGDPRQIDMFPTHR